MNEFDSKMIPGRTSTEPNAPWRLSAARAAGSLSLVVALLAAGCQNNAVPPPTDDGPIYNNTTDRTNAGASFVGTSACSACHPGIADTHNVHGHAQIMQRIEGSPPTYPAVGPGPGVPNPPDSLTWENVIYVIGGYTRKALFLDSDGYLMTNDAEGVDTQWNLDFAPNGNAAGFGPYENDGHFSPADPKAYDHNCFACHTVGALPQDPGDPRFQENRPGIPGTWVEPSVGCEACHGPGSNHIPNPSARDIFVDVDGKLCTECHARPFQSDGSVIMAKNGYIEPYQQWSELRASGAHANFSCTRCHAPHTSVTYSRETAMVRECTTCHGDQNMALHEGRTYVRDGYVEALSCESCHMTFATKSASAATAGVVGADGRMGDEQSHIFRINTDQTDYTAMFTGDMSAVEKDDQGRAAVTVDFVCIRCHNGIGNAFPLTIKSAGEIALSMHGFEDH